ncbi:hypothetical protein RJ639_020581 [Escallonia herrerae]|uniref:Fe2OG dioxygenase domain-containing protein n=1 Tax=Escallonia herrerae TaxID=1293975 RepID=A0AA89AH00_9ASTE|nr:hypothetical protein RJ639_020581 [Escallonia herrerae]
MASSKAISHGNVQVLAKEITFALPQQYIQANQEPTVLLDGTNCLPAVPVVDMRHLIMGEAEKFELERLHSICKEWGVFQLVNHGISSLLVEKVKSEIERFFKLSLEEKMRYKQRPGDFEGYGQTPVHSADEKVDWSDKFLMITNPVHRRKPYLLPELPSSLREAMESYISEVQRLAMKLLGLMAQALKMDKGEMEEMFEDGMQFMRMTYYPPCPQPEQVVGLRPHSDATGLTILLQVNGVEGLQVKRNGVWIPVKFLSDAFVVNVGDILEILSNGIYSSAEHRATVNSVNERISTAMFFNPKFSAEIRPATSLISMTNPPLFKKIGGEKYVKDFFSRKLCGKSFLDDMKIENANTAILDGESLL